MGARRFGGFEFDPSSRELRKGRTRIGVPDQSLAILAMLLEHPGELVTREAIQARLWPNGTVVEFEHSVNSAVNRLRQALSDPASTPRFLETLPRKGYRFIGTLEPAPGEPARLTPGTIISHYRILAEVGRGAMGVVYKAEDTNLDRMVALKFLTDELATHPPALERLRREARMIGALNHPGICTIYELGEASGRVFLAMELLQGESFRERMAQNPFSQEELLDMATQVAMALEAAHGQGVVHRDIKPDNLILTKQGVVKLMDFGLAKPVEEESGTAPQSSLTGTSGYMSPEQMRGEALDARSDIYSLGKVLAELAGESPPKKLVPVIGKALADDPVKRWQSASELRAALESTRRKRIPRTALTAAVLLVAAFTWLLLYRLPHPSAESSITEKRLTFNSSANPVLGGRISPDGKYLAYSDPAGIHVKLLSTGEDRFIPRPAGVPDSADWTVDSWFPDGTLLLADAHQLGGHKGMWTVSVLGQSPRRLRDGAVGFEVSPDGTHIAYSPMGTADDTREIWVMGSHGDNPQKAFAIEESDLLSRVHWSPDGQRLAYIRMHRSSGTFQYFIETCDLKGASRTVVVASELLVNDFCWLPDRQIVYARQDPLNLSDVNLWQVGIDNHTGTPAGPPKRITQWFGSGLLGMNASADGRRLSLFKFTYQFQVYLGELTAGGTRMSPPRRLTHNETSDSPSAWTADSKAVFLLSDRNGTSGIYKQGIRQETAEPVFTGPRDVEAPTRLSPDGAWLLFELSPVPRPAPVSRLVRVPAGGGVPQLVLEARNLTSYACANAPASLCVLVETSRDGKQSTITAFDPLKGRGRVLRTISDDISDWGYSLSPDGSTFAISRHNQTDIHIRLLAMSGGSDREITVKGWPNTVGLDWSTDGKGFYCGSQSPQGSTLLYVDLHGNARPLWQLKGWTGDIWGVPSPDGRYLAIFAGVIYGNVWMLEGF